MLLIDNRDSRDPAIHLALEEFLLRQCPGGETLLLFYVNAPAVVIGRNQVPHGEVNLEEVMRRRIKVVRRLSGGGTVYHDPGNLNFSVIQPQGDEAILSPAEVLQPVVKGLNAMGVPVHTNTRHDILLDGLKVTGVAQYRTRDRCLTHGTLLVSADLEALRRVLAPDSEVLFSRGRPSIPSPVANLRHHDPGLTMEKVRQALIRSLADRHGPVSALSLSLEDWDRVRKAARSKYDSWEWSLGRSPEFHLRRCAVFPWGRCAAILHIQRGIMSRIELSLPGNAPTFQHKLATALQGGRYHPEDVATAFREAGVLRETPAVADAVADWLGASGCPWR